MTTAITTRPRVQPQGPNHNELDRAEFLQNVLAGNVAIAKRFKLDRVQVDLTVAEELCQLLADSLRTAKQLQETGHHA